MERQKNGTKVMVFSPKSISSTKQRPKSMEPHILAALKDSSRDPTQRVVEAIMRVGPRNAALISRLTGVPTETVRYKIKKQLKEMGFRIHADVDYEGLGLRRHWATIDFTPEYSELAVQILRALHEIGDLIYYARIVPQGHYVVLFALPEGSTPRFGDFLRHLVDSGVIGTFSLEEVAWSRHLSMNPKYFNFDRGKWEMDWSRVGSEKPDIEKPTEAYGKAEVDRADLLLIKELQKDSIQSIIDVARKVKIHPKTLRYHYHTHVQRRKLIPRYLVRWMRDIESTRAHSIVFARFVFSQLNEVELSRVRLGINRLPFIWSEYLCKDSNDYIASVFAPVEEYSEVFDYLRRQIIGFGHKLHVDFIDPSVASLFTVPYQMFDTERGWQLNLHDLKARFSNLVTTLQTAK